MAITALLHQILPLERRKESAPLTAIDIFLGWVLFSGVIGNIFFFDRQGVAFLGGIVYGLVFIPYFLIRWLGRP
jgi:putative membrane protein